MASDSDDSPQFSDDLIREIFQLRYNETNKNVKVNDAAIALSSQLLRLFATEAIYRAAEIADAERAEMSEEDKRGPALLQVEHLAKILPGLLLDFA